MDGPTELLTPGKVFKTIFMLGPATNGVSLIVFCHADTHTRKKQPTLLWYNDELTRLHKSCVFSEVHNDHWSTDSCQTLSRDMADYNISR